MKFQQYTLPNKARVILAPRPGTEVCTTLVLFKVGSRHETARTNGVSHFLEHLFFKGTTNRPTALDISQVLDGLGAQYNAFTGKDYTGYYVKVGSQHTSTAVDLLQDLLLNPLFEQDEIDRERGVVIEEINMYDDNPMAIVEEVLEETVFGKTHPLGYRIAGPKENIQTITRKQILNYRTTHYRPDRMVIVLAGKVPAQVKQWLKNGFGQMSLPQQKQSVPKPFGATQRAFRLQLETKPTAQSHLAIGFPAPAYNHTDLLATKVLATLLGGGMSSRLFINVRERQGLCYYIRASVSPYEDTGIFTVNAGFDTSRIHQAIAAIMEQLQLIAEHRVDPVELQKAKDCIRGHLQIQLEDSEYVASWWAHQALFLRNSITPAQYESKIDNITPAQIQRVAARLFQFHRMTAAIVGPYTQRHATKLQRSFATLKR